MDIKLRARLSAYSKVSAVSGGSSSDLIPTPSSANAGDVLGVSNEGNYQFVPHVTPEEIDSLFSGMKPVIETVTKDEIDGLFDEESVTTETRVTHADIDTLFE